MPNALVPATPELTAAWFRKDPQKAARMLLGARLVVGRCAGIVVETEAYADDEASHFVTRAPSAAELMLTRGRLYIYRIHNRTCLNITAGCGGPGAVLIRTVEPTAGIRLMASRRRASLPGLTIDPGRPETLRRLTSGPARLCEAFAVSMAMNGTPVGETVLLYGPKKPVQTRAAPRVGVTKATDLKWRFMLDGNPFVSRKQ